MRRGSILIILLFICAGVWAQKIIVSGIVVGSDTDDKISGATVAAAGSSVQVVTNDDGFFTLKLDTMTNAIVVSHIGYRSERVKLEERNLNDLKVRLRPTAIQLREVLVTADDPRELVEAAIRKIPKNYSMVPELYNCFYRETAMKRQHYICVAEGVVDMYKTAYSKSTSHDRVAIRKGRRLLSPKHSDTLSVKVLGGPVGPVVLDVVKNTDFLLNPADLECYDMKMDNPESIDDRMQYVVRISPAKEMPWALYYGKLYIDQENLAFTRVDLTLDVSDRDKATRLMLVKKPSGVRFRPRELSLLVDYRQENGVTRISYIRSTFRFNCDWRRRLFATSFTAMCEMVVTDRKNQDVQPIRGRESFDQQDAFFDKVDYFRDPTFWQDYNIIEPTETLDKAIGRIIKKY